MYSSVHRSLQDVQIWFQPNLGSGSSLFLPHSDSNDGFGELREPLVVINQNYSLLGIRDFRNIIPDFHGLIGLCASLGFSDHLTDMSMEGLSSDKESGCGSQNDLRKIPTLPAPADFMSPTGATTMPKLMTPDAFMTPSASVCPVPNSLYCIKITANIQGRMITPGS